MISRLQNSIFCFALFLTLVAQAADDSSDISIAQLSLKCAQSPSAEIIIERDNDKFTQPEEMTMFRCEGDAAQKLFDALLSVNDSSRVEISSEHFDDPNSYDFTNETMLSFGPKTFGYDSSKQRSHCVKKKETYTLDQYETTSYHCKIPIGLSRL